MSAEQAKPFDDADMRPEKPLRGRVGRKMGQITSRAKELLSTPEYLIADILPQDPNDRRPVITYPEIDIIMRVAEEDPDVRGKIYRLESGPHDLYQNEEDRRFLYYEYYKGTRDDEGRPTIPENSTFYKVVNEKGDILAVSTVRWKGVDFIRRGRTAYRERTLVLNPNHRDKGIALALGIRANDDILYRSKHYDGLPATRAESSILKDRIAGRHDINHNYLTLLAYDQHGYPIWVKDGVRVDHRIDDDTRQVQPYAITLQSWEKARPIAIDHLARKQPAMAKQLKNIWPELRRSLAERDPGYARNFF